MKLYLVRHGESIGNITKEYISGRSDKRGLSERGKIQITRTAWELRKVQFTHVYSSPVVRAMESARILTRHTQQKIIPFEYFTELSYGKFEGMHWQEIRDMVTPELRQKRQVDFAFSFMESESFRDVLDRVYDGLLLLLQTHKPDETVLIVAHNLTISTIVFCLQHKALTKEELLNKGKEYLDYIHKTDIPNACIVQIDVKKDAVTIGDIQSHFPPVNVHTDAIEFYWNTLYPHDQKNKAKRLSTQSGNYVYELLDGNDALLKLLNEQDCLKSQRLSNLYSVLNECKLPVPHVIHHDPTHVFFQQDSLAHDYIPGDTQERCLKEGHHIGSKKFFSQLYKTLQKIYSIPLPLLREILLVGDSGEHDGEWKVFMTHEIGKTLETLKNVKKLHDYGKIERHLKQLKEYLTSQNQDLFFIHGDLAPQNILARHDKKGCGLVRILDFERSRIGDPLWDYVYYYGFMERHTKVIAELWRKTIWHDLSKESQKAFWNYWVLFHAWTVRDMVDYKDNPTRSTFGHESLSIVNNAH